LIKQKTDTLERKRGLKMKYKVGDKVRIVKKKTGDYWNWNHGGNMDHWLDSIMTVRKIEGDHYRMKEDENEHFDNGWVWREDMIAGLADEPKNNMI